MLIKTGYDIRYESDVATPMIAMLSIRPERWRDLKTPQRITATPEVPLTDYVDGFGNVCTRLVVPAGGVLLSADFVIKDSGQPDRVNENAVQVPVEDLPADVLVYLLGSRYCETDRLSDAAWALFGQGPTGWARVQAIVQYAHERIEFGYHHARATKTAFEAHDERRGVCRDFAHLAITLCRCMNIPARYCTGYMGDIGIPKVDDPMDFSAWMEVYLDGEWYTFDARHNRPRIGRIVMAHGRDATDTALTTTFGPAALVGFDVHTDEIDETA